jgi:hypothetical protein
MTHFSQGAYERVVMIYERSIPDIGHLLMLWVNLESSVMYTTNVNHVER